MTDFKKCDVSTYPRSPLEPQFEDVVVSAALNHLVPGVVAAVVALVCLKQVVCRHLVTTDQQTLEKKKKIKLRLLKRVIAFYYLEKPSFRKKVYVKCRDFFSVEKVKIFFSK